MAAALFCVGWLLLAGWGAAQYRQASHRGPVLYAPLSVAVDPADGTIYCASAAGRIHKYGPDGLGRGAFAVDLPSTSVRLGADGPGRIVLATEGDDRVRVFDEGGRPIEERLDADAWRRFGLAPAVAPEIGRAGDVDPAGAGVPAVIVLEGGAIVERSGSDVRVLVPALPFPLVWFAAAPWTLVLSLFLSTLGLMASFVWPFLARPDDAFVR